MDTLVLAISLGQIVPRRSGTQNPQNSVHKKTVIDRGSTDMLRTARKKDLDLLIARSLV
jgi:hypothetical protein